MKKLIVVLFVVLMAVSVSGQQIQLGNFPVGQWLDPNYNAIWEFSSNNIRILSPNGSVYHDFSNYTIQNFRVFMEGTAPGISFTCPDTGRSYRFIKPLTNNDLVMEIDREGRPSYSVTQQTWTGQLPTPPAQPAAAGSGRLTITNASDEPDPEFEAMISIYSVAVYSLTAPVEYWTGLVEADRAGKMIAASGSVSSPVTLRLPNPNDPINPQDNSNQPVFTRSGTFLVVFSVGPTPAYRQKMVTFTNGSATVDFKTMQSLEGMRGG
ncbi:MAG: hypothetical protein FWG29_06875 [Treponema sp.]|nr:hypothetical protein [Treponema sp.]